jgi:DNA-binding NarL/FixJ family response regulator
MLEAIVGRLTRNGTITVVATAATADDLVTTFEQHRPDVVLSDYSMPGPPVPDAIRAIVEIDANARVLVLSAYEDPALVEACLRAGAVGYLVKSIPGPELAARVLAAARGEYVLDGAAARLLAQGIRSAADPAPPVAPGRDVLSAREVEVLELVSRGMTSRQIGRDLYISPETVKTHVERILDKLGVADRAAAVRVAMERGLLG